MKALNYILSLVVLLSALSYTGCKKDDDPISGAQPAIVSVSPAEGTVSTELTIEGSDFEDGASVYVGGVQASVVDVASSTQIFAQVPAGIEANVALDVRVVNPGGRDATIEDAFTAIAPVLTYINSATKPSGNTGSTVILEGKAFGSVQGTSKVLFSDGAGGTVEATIASADDWTDEFIVSTVPSGAQDGPVSIVTELGTSNEIEFNVTEAATFSPSTINWTLTAALPLAVSGHNAIYVPIDDQSGTTQNYVYVTGGRDDAGTAQDQALYGKINTDGTITSWTSTTALPSALAFHNAIAATPFNSKVGGSGYLYLLGGVDGSDAIVNTISIAPFNNDGTLSTWGTATALPEPLHSVGAAIFRSTIYIGGGSTTGDVPVNKVYKSQIDENGNLGDWVELASLPSARTFHGFVTFGAYLYSVGGETGTVTPDDGNFQTNDSKLGEVAYAKIDLRSGDITDAGWTVNANSLQKSRSKHTTLVVGGNMFVSSGLYSAAGTGSSENTYAQILADGTVGSFGGATGSNTLFSVGGVNLFNQAGLSYVDADGVAHVLIVGGDNVEAPGSKVANVLYY